MDPTVEREPPVCARGAARERLRPWMHARLRRREAATMGIQCERCGRLVIGEVLPPEPEGQRGRVRVLAPATR